MLHKKLILTEMEKILQFVILSRMNGNKNISRYCPFKWHSDILILFDVVTGKIF